MHDHGEWAEFGSRIGVVYTRRLRGFEAQVINASHSQRPHANLADLPTAQAAALAAL